MLVLDEDPNPRVLLLAAIIDHQHAPVELFFRTHATPEERLIVLRPVDGSAL